MIIIGDVHGKFTDLAHKLLEAKVEHQALIQLGDFGLGFYPPEGEYQLLELLNHVLQAGENQMYVIRGNHDDPAYFTGDDRWPEFANIHLLPDYSILEAEGKRVLLAGGAISVDRKARAKGASWWPDEGFRLDEEALAALDLTDLWAVVTHAAPTVAPPNRLSQIVLFFADRDRTLLSELNQERAELDKLRDAIMKHSTPEYWFYGHYHFHVQRRIEGTNFVLLDELRFFEVPANG
jgi:predicted phosphodiesterase